MILYEQFLTYTSKSMSQPAHSYLGKETTFRDLRDQIGRLSYLYKNEIGHKARVVIIARNCPAYLKTFFALTNIRATMIPLNPDAPPSEWAEAFRETAPTHVAITSDLLTHVREFMSHERIVLPIVEIERKQGGEYDPSFIPPPDNKPLENDVVLLTRSSGMTGKSKFVQLTHKQLMHAATCIKSAYKPNSTDRFLTTQSWSHPYALIHSLLFPMMNCLTVVIDHGLQATEFLNFLTHSRANRLVGTPAFYLKLLVTCRNEKRPLTGIKSATVGLGVLSPELKRAFQVLKIPAPHVYGQVENTWTLAMERPDEMKAAQGSTADASISMRGLSGMKYKVMDDQGDEIISKDRRIGLLAVTSPSTMVGYFPKERDKDSKAVLRGSWLYTGDYAALEGEGDDLKIEFIGRKEDVILINEEISPITPMDIVLRKLPGLQDAAGFVCRTSKNQVVPMAVLVKLQGSPLTEKQAAEFCEENMPFGYNPRTILFTDSIPRDAGGNVNYHRLRILFGTLAG